MALRAQGTGPPGFCDSSEFLTNQLLARHDFQGGFFNVTVDIAVFSHAWWCLCLKIESYLTELFTRADSYSDVTSQGYMRLLRGSLQKQAQMGKYDPCLSAHVRAEKAPAQTTQPRSGQRASAVGYR